MPPIQPMQVTLGWEVAEWVACGQGATSPFTANREVEEVIVMGRGGEGRGGLTSGPADWPSLLMHCWGLPLSLEEACESLSPQSPLLAGPGPARD